MTDDLRQTANNARQAANDAVERADEATRERLLAADARVTAAEAELKAARAARGEEIAKALEDDGWSLTRIGDVLGITRQRVGQLRRGE